MLIENRLPVFAINHVSQWKIVALQQAVFDQVKLAADRALEICYFGGHQKTLLGFSLP